MQYRRLTKEQLGELQQEFINFLATQSVTAEEWQHIKRERPNVAEQELDVFSDLIWEGVLAKVDSERVEARRRRMESNRAASRAACPAKEEAA